MPIITREQVEKVCSIKEDYWREMVIDDVLKIVNHGKRYNTYRNPLTGKLPEDMSVPIAREFFGVDAYTPLPQTTDILKKIEEMERKIRELEARLEAFEKKPVPEFVNQVEDSDEEDPRYPTLSMLSKVNPNREKIREDR